MFRYSLFIPFAGTFFDYLSHMVSSKVIFSIFSDIIYALLLVFRDDILNVFSIQCILVAENSLRPLIQAADFSSLLL